MVLKYFKVQSNAVSPSNSLEVAKLVVSTITPLTIGLVGAYISYSATQNSLRQSARLSDTQIEISRQSRAFEKRQQVWDSLTPELNKLLDIQYGFAEFRPVTPLRSLFAWKSFRDVFLIRQQYFSSNFHTLMSDYLSLHANSAYYYNSFNADEVRYGCTWRRPMRWANEKLRLALACELGISRCEVPKRLGRWPFKMVKRNMHKNSPPVTFYDLRDKADRQVVLGLELR